MISTALPDIHAKKNAQSGLNGNAMIFARTADKYFYPDHKTPYLFVANFLNKGKYTLNGKPIEISDNYFYFLNANDNLAIHFSENIPLQTLLIFFEERFIEDCFSYFAFSDEDLLDLPGAASKSGVNLPNVPFEYNRVMREKIAALLQGSIATEDFDNLLFELIGGFSQTNIHTLQQIKCIHAIKKSTREELYKRIFLAKEFMNNNVCESLTLEQIAQEACLNKFHFLSNFKHVFKTTPHQFYTKLKLQKALQLLQSKQHTVADVCYLIGFESVGSFSNLFRKHFHFSPSDSTGEN